VRISLRASIQLIRVVRSAVAEVCVTPWINCIIGFVAFAGGGHGGDFGFGAGAGAFLSGVPNCAENQPSQDKDEPEDNDQLNKSERIVMTASVGMITQAFDTN